MRAFLVLPNCLFENTSAIVDHATDVVYLVEEPSFFIEFPNPLKTAYLRACMRFYRDFLETKQGFRVEYVECKDAGVKQLVARLRADGVKRIAFHDPTDHAVSARLHALPFKHKTEYETLLFELESNEVMDVDLKSNVSFLARFAKLHDWRYVGGKSYDEDNRKSLPKDHKPMKRETFDANAYYIESAKYAAKLHDTLAPDLAVLRVHPVTFRDAKKGLKVFIESRLSRYGTYQDAMHSSDVFLHHSVISPGLNIGLLTPRDVYAAVCRAVKGREQKIGMNNIEGFLRQLLGWREYMRAIYLQHGEAMMNSAEKNHWGAKGRLEWDCWTGKKPTGIPALDAEIIKVVKWGWAHHIVRLMVFLNIFVLCRVSPREVYRWFMTVCPMDAYPWVMVSNIWAMGFYDPRFMRKPYLSTSNYIVKMSDYKTKNSTWDALFYAFLHENKSRLTGSARIYLRNLAAFDRKSAEEQSAVLCEARAFIKRVTIPV